MSDSGDDSPSLPAVKRPKHGHPSNSTSAQSRNSTFSDPIHLDLDTTKTHITSYLAANNQEVQRLKAQVTQLVTQTQARNPRSRLAHDLKLFRVSLEKAHVPVLITSSEYRSLLAEQRDIHQRNSLTQTLLAYGCVFTNMEEATTILVDHQLQVPMIIRPVKPRRPNLTIAAVLEYLSLCTTVDVQIYSDHMSAYGSHPTPHKLSTSDARDMFNNPNQYGPVNLLDLTVLRQNSLPPCLEDNRAYTVFSFTGQGETAGKADQKFGNDGRYQIMASSGAISLPHRDVDGQTTALKMEEGLKIFLLHLNYTTQEFDKWKKGGAFVDPPGLVVPICLWPGDHLILPPGTIHSVYTIKPSLMTGHKLWFDQNMWTVPAAMMDDMRYTHVTNEDVTAETIDRLFRVVQLMDAGNKSTYYNWGTSSQQETFRHGVMVSTTAPVSWINSTDGKQEVHRSFNRPDSDTDEEADEEVDDHTDEEAEDDMEDDVDDGTDSEIISIHSTESEYQS